MGSDCISSRSLLIFLLLTVKVIVAWLFCFFHKNYCSLAVLIVIIAFLFTCVITYIDQRLVIVLKRKDKLSKRPSYIK